MDNPFSDWGQVIAAGGATALAYILGARKLWFKDRKDSRQDRAEEHVGGAYDEIIDIMRQQIRDSTIDRADMRKHLEECQRQHAECRTETDALRLETAGLRIRVDELERMP